MLHHVGEVALDQGGAAAPSGASPRPIASERRYRHVDTAAVHERQHIGVAGA